MSEYTYACPVCGQHMRCDSSQSGTVMECPTCFQKITAPQAPSSDEQKFILAGQKYGEKKIPTSVFNAAAQPKAPAEKKFPVWIGIVIIAALAAGGGIYFFGGKSFSEKPSSGKPSRPVSASDWLADDIGAVGAAGAFSAANGTFTISGSGADIWHQADGFHYVHQALDGDGALTAQVLDIQNTHEWAKAGAMIRETTDASSVFALASIRSDGQAQFIWRNTTGGEAAASALAGGPGFPKRVKIERSGNTFGAYFKVKAEDEWMPMGTAQTINMTPNTQIGLIVCAHNAGTLCRAQFDQLNLQADLNASPAAPTVPKVILPPTSDTNWTLNLDTVTTPDGAAVGRIHAQSSTLDRVIFQGGVLTLRQSVRGSPDVSLAINFGGALPEAIAGKTINVMTNAEQSAHVTLRWKESGQPAKEIFTNGYALRLEMGALTNNHLPGKIYFCAPDESKSYALGTFNAEIRKPRPPKPRI